ncbi:hypothetical protein [Streptomyces hokutonensis]|uniref:hypothetical protein n=1 Tax=Streptomyces hokutonensis TaxID=1306990 RepID=UPI0003A5F60A|nr:hypothetical protein [Streptomyces hokutonensis]
MAGRGRVVRRSGRVQLGPGTAGSSAVPLAILIALAGHVLLNERRSPARPTSPPPGTGGERYRVTERTA